MSTKPLFADISSEESITVTGGATNLSFHLDDYLFVLGAGAVFGNGIPFIPTPVEIDFAWRKAIYPAGLPFNPTV